MEPGRDAPEATFSIPSTLTVRARYSPSSSVRPVIGSILPNVLSPSISRASGIGT